MSAFGLLVGAVPVGRLDLAMAGLRSQKGVLRICLTADPDNFPKCIDDARAKTASVPATAAAASFDGLPAGRYAVAVIHDENSNHKLDTLMGIPREGFGFSRNPVIRFGPPSFSSAAFALPDGHSEQDIRLRYML